MQAVLPGHALFISATNLRTGKIRFFEGAEISPPVIVASACLPTLFRAVEIAGPRTGQVDACRDGGHTGNPALFDPGLADVLGGTCRSRPSSSRRPRIGEGATVDLEEMFG
jgi:hypothetical protein